MYSSEENPTALGHFGLMYLHWFVPLHCFHWPTDTARYQSGRSVQQSEEEWHHPVYEEGIQYIVMGTI